MYSSLAYNRKFFNLKRKQAFQASKHKICLCIHDYIHIQMLVLKTIFLTQDNLTAFCMNKVSGGLVSVSTPKEILEVKQTFTSFEVNIVNKIYIDESTVGFTVD